MKSRSLSVLAEALRKTFRQTGPRQAERMAIAVLRLSEGDFADLMNAFVEARRRVRRCRVCQNLTETEICSICGDPHREPNLICVVENAQDVEALETAGSFRGLYHVLHGSLDARLGPQRFQAQLPLTFAELTGRLRKDGSIKELILALDQDSEGEITSLYLADLIARQFPHIKLTRIGMGLPFGGEVVYADSSTLKQALLARVELAKTAAL